MRVAAPDRRRQILAAAVELFARQGYQGTTTRAIAQRARVNEAILFRHFPSKEALYWAVIEQKCAGARRRERLEQHLQAEASDREVFRKLALEILQRNWEDTNLSRLLLFSALENHRLSQRFFRTYVASYYEKLARHIQKRVAEGVFRAVDPLLAARGFIGMVFYHFLVQELFGGKKYQRFEPQRVAEEMADIWLQGVLARAARNGANGHSRRNGKDNGNGKGKELGFLS